MVYHLVRAPLNRFHDITPKGQIINRLSRDINTIEDNFFQTYSSLVAFTTAFIYGVVMCSIYQPFCLILIPMLGIIGSMLTNFYVNFCANRCNPLIERSLPFITEYNAETTFLKVES